MIKKKKDLKTDAFFPTLTKNVSLFIGIFPGGSDSKIFACNAEEPGLIPGLERSLEKGMAPLQYSCLEYFITVILYLDFNFLLSLLFSC